MTELKAKMKPLMDWAIKMSTLFNEIEKATTITFEVNEENKEYVARATLDGKDYEIRRPEGYMGETSITLPPIFAPGMIKEILAEWAKDNDISLDPPQTPRESMRCIWEGKK